MAERNAADTGWTLVPDVLWVDMVLESSKSPPTSSLLNPETMVAAASIKVMSSFRSARKSRALGNKDSSSSSSSTSPGFETSSSPSSKSISLASAGRFPDSISIVSSASSAVVSGLVS